jgi:hypothetical protein
LTAPTTKTAEPKATETTEAAPKATPKPEPKAKPKPTAVSVSAAALLTAFEENELAADAAYKGKTLRITGTIEKIDTEPFDENDYVLDLTGGDDFAFLTVTAYDIPNDDLSKLHTGETVTVICQFKDGGDLGVTVNKCKMD